MSTESDPVALLAKVVSLLFIKVHIYVRVTIFCDQNPELTYGWKIRQVHNKALQAPGRAIAAAISHLKVLHLRRDSE